MVNSIRIWIWLNCLFFFFTSFSHAQVSDKSIHKAELKSIADTPLPFIHNQGQLNNPAVAYYADTFACRLMVTTSGRLAYDAPGRPQKPSAIHQLMGERLIGAAPLTVRGENKSATKYHIFDGPKKEDWHRNIASYQTLTLEKVYQGIELKLTYHDRNVEKLFYIDPGANPDQIRLAVDNVQHLSVNHKGELVLGKTSGDLQFSKPVAYQWDGQNRQPVAVDYHIQGKTYGFKLGPYDPSKKLIIDPLVNSYSVESSEVDSAISAMISDNEGKIYAAGISNKEFVVYKFDPNIKEITDFVQFDRANYKSISSLSNLATAIALDSQNNVFVVGTTMSGSFPVTKESCVDDRIGSSGFQEGFIIKFDADLTRLIAATYLGGDNPDIVTGIAIDKQDNIYVAGHSENPSDHGIAQKFPITDNGFDPSPGPEQKQKAFICKLSNDLTTLLSSTFLGGNENKNANDIIGSITLDDNGNVYVGGATMSTDFPIQGGADTEFTGKSEAFVAKFSPDLTHLEASTFLGGMNVDSTDEQIQAIVIDQNPPAAIYVGGWTNSTDFPMPKGKGYDTGHNKEEDGFIAKLNLDLNQIESATFLGGHSKDEVFCMALRPSDNGKGALIVGGVTESTNFPTTQGCHDDKYAKAKVYGKVGGRRPNDKTDGFIAIFDLELSTLISSTYFGGEYAEFIDAVIVNGDDILLSGQTGSHEDFLPLMPDSFKDYYSRGFIARFNGNINSGKGSDEPSKGEDENGDKTKEPKPGENKTNGGGGGGGGCFIDALPPWLHID